LDKFLEANKVGLTPVAEDETFEDLKKDMDLIDVENMDPKKKKSGSKDNSPGRERRGSDITGNEEFKSKNEQMKKENFEVASEKVLLDVTK